MQIKNHWFVVLLNIFFIPFLYFLEWRKKHTMYSPRKGVYYKVRVNTWDKFSVFETWKLNVYGDFNFGSNKPTILDIGAHIGAFAIFASAKAPKGRIFAYEPNPESFELLKDNIKHNKCSNIKIFNTAVTEKKGSMEFFIDKNSVLGSVYNKNGRKVVIPTVSLSDILLENRLPAVDLLKMDVEGAEYQILFHTSKETLSQIKRIEMEVHEFSESKDNALSMADFLTENGFNVTMSGPWLLKHIFGISYIRATRE